MRGIFEKIINLLFPKEVPVIELERMSPEELARRLSPARPENGITPLFSYKDKRVKTLVLEIKIHENKILAEKVAEIMCEKILESFEEDLQFEEHKIFLVPVPTSHNRANERGYNPAELIARKIVEMRPDIFEYVSLLKKIRETKRQTRLSRAERLTNLVGAFVSVETNAPVIIIDDVSTTGATILEARRALQEKNIFVRGAYVVAK